MIVARLEKDIAAAIRAALELIGCDVSSTQQTRRSRQTVGMPDLWVSHRAWRVSGWLEVKRPGARPTIGQRIWHDNAKAAGVHVELVSSVQEAVNAVTSWRVPPPDWDRGQ